MMISPHTLFKECYGKYAVAAINVFTMEQVLAVFRAADTSRSPVIIQTTPVARDYATPEVLTAMITSAARVYPDVVFTLHLDHGNEAHIANALGSGQYGSLMIDASHDPLKQNISRTREVVSMAHKKTCLLKPNWGC
nr:class II fructose-bisphosphate aldolase [Parapedobacter soli]